MSKQPDMPREVEKINESISNPKRKVPEKDTLVGDRSLAAGRGAEIAGSKPDSETEKALKRGSRSR